MELLDRFARGDLEAFELLFRQFQGDVYGWVLRILRNPADAEEATVEAFWRIYRAHARFDPTRSFGAWARRVACNVALDHLRRARGARVTTGMPTSPTPNSSGRRDLHIRVERAFLQLPPKLRMVAELAFIEEWPHEDIASALGISRSAVKSRAFRAMRHLKEALHREGVEP